MFALMRNKMHLKNNQIIMSKNSHPVTNYGTSIKQ